MRYAIKTGNNTYYWRANEIIDYQHPHPILFDTLREASEVRKGIDIINSFLKQKGREFLEHEIIEVRDES